MEATQEIIDGHAFLYRVGARNLTADGLWYDSEGREIGIIHTLTEGSAGALPMGPHPIFRTDGYKWTSVTDSIDNLRFWFSEQDMKELLEMDYEVLEIEVHGYRRFHFETYSHEVFSDHQLINIRSIDASILYPSLKLEDV